jgi:thiamine kinase-like enzyme
MSEPGETPEEPGETPEELVEIPEEPAELTAEWLSEVLNWPVRSVRQEVLGQGQGFLGDIVRLHLDTEAADCPATVIAKLPKKANRSMGEMLGVYEREVMFFRDYAVTIPVRIPTVYFSHYDPDAGSAKQKDILGALDKLPRFLTPAISALGKRIAAAKERRYLVIMEDLGEFQPGDQFAGASPEACARVLEQFAPAHRHFWQADGLDDKFWLLPYEIDARMRQGMLRATLDQFRAEASERLRPYVEWLAENSARLTTALAADAPVTLIHCDLRLDNICFDGDRCAFLDWQLTRSGPAAYDVGYFLGGALSEEVSAAEEDRILARYHTALGQHDYPFERFYHDYQRALMASLASVMPTPDIAIDAGRGQAMMARWRSRLEARLARVDVDTLL